MTFFDVIIAIVLLIAVLLGLKDGFVRRMVGTIGIILTIYLMIRLSNPLGEFINQHFGIELYFASFLAAVFIFFSGFFLTAVLKRVIHPFNKFNNVINQLLGGVVGFFQVLFVISILLLVLRIFNVPSKETASSSLFYDDVSGFVVFVYDTFGEFTPSTTNYIRSELKQEVSKYIDSEKSQ